MQESALQILTEEWGHTPDKVFEHLPEIPAAAASIGQVYKVGSMSKTTQAFLKHILQETLS